MGVPLPTVLSRGTGLVLADDPSLNVRAAALAGWWAAPGGTPRQPLRVVVDSRLRTPPHARTLALLEHFGPGVASLHTLRGTSHNTVSDSAAYLPLLRGAQ